jgi:DNA-binding MarR family transcriptional regulator
MKGWSNMKKEKRTFKSVMIKFQHDIAKNDIQILYKFKDISKLSLNSVLYLDIIEGKNGEYTASTLADTLHIAKPSVTQKLNELEKNGYICKKQDEHDKRIYYLFRTSKNDEVSKAFEKSDLDLERALLINYSNEEVEKFYDMIQFMGDFYDNQ